MGAWGAGIFESDGALDWLGDLTDSPQGWSLVRQALSHVAEAAPEDDVEAPECEAALAAAEAVATARGKPAAKPNEDLVQWCKAHPLKDPSTLASLAAKAVRRIRTSSELKDLWEEGDDQEWDPVVADLEKRLL